MRTHTDGPWSTNLNGLARDRQDAPQWTVGKTCECLAVLPNRNTPEETEANAHLIAAAPDLLAALVNCLPLLEASHLDMIDAEQEDSADLVFIGLEQVRNAIAKAKGDA